MNSIETINTFNSFALGYSMNFVRTAFSQLPKHNICHLESKFIKCYDDRGSYGAMIAFWSQLSVTNREILTEYITKIHKI